MYVPTYVVATFIRTQVITIFNSLFRPVVTYNLTVTLPLSVFDDIKKDYAPCTLHSISMHAQVKLFGEK
jgi:hypothetical protein